MTSQPDPKDGPPHDVLEKIVGEALYFEYPHPVIGDVQRKVVLEAVAKIRTALRVVPPEGGPRPEMAPMQREEYERRREHWAEVGKPLSDAIHESTDIRAEDLALRVGGQPPSDGMPSEERTALWHVIAGWSFHDDDCPAGNSDDAECNCGYYDAMRAAQRFHPGAAERGVSAVPPTEEPTNE